MNDAQEQILVDLLAELLRELKGIREEQKATNELLSKVIEFMPTEPVNVYVENAGDI